MLLEGVSDEMWGVSNGKVLAFGGVEVQLPISGPAGADVKGVLENIMAISGGEELDVIRIEEAVCEQAVGQVIDVDDKQYRAYDRALGYTTYGLSYLG